MSPIRSLQPRAAVGAIVLLGLTAVSCQEPSYRNEVTPTGQGGVEVRRVPKDKADLARDSSSNLAPARPIDPDLAAVEDQWPRLSPADRQTVVDLVRRLASR